MTFLIRVYSWNVLHSATQGMHACTRIIKPLSCQWLGGQQQGLNVGQLLLPLRAIDATHCQILALEWQNLPVFFCHRSWNLSRCSFGFREQIMPAPLSRASVAFHETLREGVDSVRAISWWCEEGGDANRSHAPCAPVFVPSQQSHTPPCLKMVLGWVTHANY